MDKYKIIKFLGKGAFGITYLVEKSERLYVMKVISLARVNLKDILSEIKILKKISKINECDGGNYYAGLCLVDNFINVNEYVIVTNYIENGMTLGKYMDRYKDLNEKISEENIKFVMRNLISQLSILHDNGIVHNDIKPDNIIIQLEGERIIKCLFIDFGLSCIKLCRAGGTIMYLAPELFRIISMDYENILKLKEKLLKNPKTEDEGRMIPINRQDFMKTDIYSLGVVFYELIHNKLPYLYKYDYIRAKVQYYKQNKGEFERDLLQLKNKNDSLYKSIEELESPDKEEEILNKIDAYVNETLPENILSPDSILSYYNFYKTKPHFVSESFDKNIDNIVNEMLITNPLNRPGIYRIKKLMNKVSD